MNVMDARTAKLVKAALKPARPSVIEGESGPTEQGWHSIEAAFRCWKEYQFATVRKIRPAHEPQQLPDYFAIGSLFHAGRARWFARQFATDTKALASVRSAIKDETYRLPTPCTPEAERRAVLLVEQYIEHWSTRPHPQPIATEYKLGPAPFGDVGDPAYLHRTARLDDLSHYAEAGGGLAIGEGKTTSTEFNDVVTQYQQHGQLLLQAALYHLAPQGEKTHGPIKGIVLDIAKKGYGKEKAKFMREFIPINQYALNWFIKEMRAVLEHKRSVTWNSDEQRNISGCSRKIGRMRIACPYLALCQHGRNAALKYEIDGVMLHQWKLPPQLEGEKPTVPVVRPWE